MRSRSVVDLRSGRYPPVVVDAAPPGALSRTARDLRIPASAAAVGLVIALAGLPAPVAIRTPAEVVAGLVVPGVLLFSSFSRIPELPIRVGTSVIGVIASWTGVSTVGFAVRHALYGPAPVSDRAVILMLVAVYLLGLGTQVMMRAERLWRPSRPSPAPDQRTDAASPSRDEIEHPSDH